MFNRCPGQDSRKVKAENIICPDCGSLAEIFTDEIKVTCPGCKHSIARSKLPSCLDWCKAAGACLGEEKYKQLKGGR